MDPDPDPGGPKTSGSGGSGSGFGFATLLERKAGVHVPDVHNDDKLGSKLREVTGRLQDDVKGEEGVQRVRQARPAPGLCALN
jgi:hypothetical protein